MRSRVLALVVAIGAGLAACGGGDGGTTGAPTTATSAPTTVVATTTTIVTLEAFTASICAAGFSIADAKPGRAAGYKLNIETFSKVVPTLDKKADLDTYIEANRALATLWSDPTPTTPEAFMAQNNKHVETLLTSREKVQVECPPRPGVTTTVATTIRASGQLYSVLREEKAKGLWWYAGFACPESKKVKLGPGVAPVTGQAAAGAVLDEAAGAADPFTGVLADESYNRVADKLSATCA